MPPRRDDATCPCCGQRMLLRHGVALSPRLADLFDMVEHAGERGIAMEVLIDVFYPGKSSRAPRQCVKANVYHLNTRLAETYLEVRASFWEPYRVIRRAAP